MSGSFTIGTCFVFGALHGLEPGHGNSFVAAYAMGERFRFKELLALVGSMLGSQFLLLSVLAFTLQASYSQAVMAHGEGPVWLERLAIFAPVMIILFGIYLLWSASRRNTTIAAVPGDTKNTIRKAGLVGLFAGLIPCPTALIPLIHLAGANDITAVSPAVMLSWILIYVLGMAVVLALLSAVLIYANKTFADRIASLGMSFNARKLAGMLVILVGVIYLFVNLGADMHILHSH